jgi:hypothetical protein
MKIADACGLRSELGRLRHMQKPPRFEPTAAAIVRNRVETPECMMISDLDASGAANRR